MNIHLTPPHPMPVPPQTGPGGGGMGYSVYNTSSTYSIHSRYFTVCPVCTLCTDRTLCKVCTVCTYVRRYLVPSTWYQATTWYLVCIHMHQSASVCIRMRSYASVTHPYAPICLATLPLRIQLLLFKHMFAEMSQHVRVSKSRHDNCDR